MFVERAEGLYYHKINISPLSAVRSPVRAQKVKKTTGKTDKS
jgi:hypothetical protein